MKIRTEQALFGYDEGHRLLASSAALAPGTQRILRTLTDAAFEGSATTFLTVQPLEAERVQAFIRTWRADDWNRPGSVWSHVLLIGQSELSRMTGFGAIAQAFRRPRPVNGSLSESEVAAYERTMEIRGDQAVKVPNLELAALRELVNAAYTTDEPIAYRVKQVEQFESALLALTEQQWPRLRRNFSCRTRQRPTRSAFDLEIVERLSRSGPGSRGPIDHEADEIRPWVDRLVKDLVEPDQSFREFLRLGGTESRRGRGDLRPLVELYDRITRPVPDTVTTAIAVRHAFPSPDSQTLLKASLFGKAGSELLGRWPTDEASRLVAALAASPALNLKELEFGVRLARLAMTPGGAAHVARMDLEALPFEALEPVLGEVAGAVDLDAAVALASALPELGALIVARRPELLGQSEVWRSVDIGLLVDLLEVQSAKTVESVLGSLLGQDAVEPLAAITSAKPALWWDLLGQVGSRKSYRLAAGSGTLRSVLTRIGSAALGTPPTGGLVAPGALVALALSADLNVGLWRRVPAQDWVDLLSRLDAVNPPRFVVERVFAIALTTAVQSNSAKVRTQGWQLCFEFLHTTLQDSSFDEEGWRLLANVLPAGFEWDRCNRLRRGAAWEARRDEWPPASVARLVESSLPFQEDMLELVNARGQKKKDLWLRSLLRLLE